MSPPGLPAAGSRAAGAPAPAASGQARGAAGDSAGASPAPPPEDLRGDGAAAWETVRERLHDRGLRWTPQRRALVAVLAETRGHVTGAELVERCRERDPATIPSTVYRTLDVLEELGIVRHGHGPDGREQYHVLPAEEHGHLYCQACGGTWEISADEAGAITASLDAERGFAVDLSHVTIVGRCRACR